MGVGVAAGVGGADQGGDLQGASAAGAGAAELLFGAVAAPLAGKRDAGGVLSRAAVDESRWDVSGCGRHAGERGGVRSAGLVRGGTGAARSRSCVWSGWPRRGTHAITSAAFGPYTSSEVALADELLGGLGKGCCAWLTAASTASSVPDGLARPGRSCSGGSGANVVLPREQTLADGSYLTHIYAPRPRPRTAPASRRGSSSTRLEDPGLPASEQRYRLLTTILDPEQHRPRAGRALPRALGIEGAIDELKTHQRGPRIVLRSKHPDGVYQEAYGYLCTHYAIRRLMHDAALRADLDPDRLSFTRGLRAARRSTRSQPGFSPPQPQPHMNKRSPRSSPSHSPNAASAPTPASIKHKMSNWASNAPNTTTGPSQPGRQTTHHHPRRLSKR